MFVNSMGLDLYVWLAYRLHVLSNPTPIRWPRPRQQFGPAPETAVSVQPRFRQPSRGTRMLASYSANGVTV
jgi:hypothetical protein